MWTSTNDVVIAAFALLAAVLLSAGVYLVYIAPNVLSEAALQVATGLVRPAKRLREASWVGGVFKSTRWLFVLVALATFLVGSVASRVCPKATKAPKCCCTARRRRSVDYRPSTPAPSPQCPSLAPEQHASIRAPLGGEVIG